MKNMTTILKQNSRIDQLDLTMCIIGSRKVGPEDQLYSQGWHVFAPNLRVIGFEPDQQACDVLNQEAASLSWVEEHFPLALAETDGLVPFYITRNPACSSLYKPNEPLLNRFKGLRDQVELKKEDVLAVISLDQFCDFYEINKVDVIQLDVQGADLNILRGGLKTLTQVLSITVEVEFSPLYEGQPLFADVDIFLRNQGFVLLDLWTKRVPKKSSPVEGIEHPGQLLWGDAFYFRDPLMCGKDSKYKSAESCLKLACIADVMGFVDYALELFQHLTIMYGAADSRYNFADEITEALEQIPELVGQGLLTFPIIQSIEPYMSSSCRERLR
ncbi:MAG: FkbM family methyltransferase [Synechococcaceae cyanobacterium SM2_3_1]|nr:FkbM family methyltransferase [Synechococcaceae cyanobacterium SM2_3_1]